MRLNHAFEAMAIALVTSAFAAPAVLPNEEVARNRALPAPETPGSRDERDSAWQAICQQAAEPMPNIQIHDHMDSARRSATSPIKSHMKEKRPD